MLRLRVRSPSAPLNPARTWGETRSTSGRLTEKSDRVSGCTMPGRRRRDPAPFWWGARKCYYLQVGKRQIKLSPDLEEAKRLAHRILAELPQDESPAAAIVAAGPLVV